MKKTPLKYKRKLIVGTAQLNTDYGITNDRIAVGNEVLNAAKINSIDAIDTAIKYTNAIHSIKDYPNYFKVFSKINCSELSSWETSKINDLIDSHADALQCDVIDGLLIHDTDDILKQNKMGKLIDLLNTISWHPKVMKCGVSIYEYSHLAELNQNCKLDIIQFPANILDKRFQCADSLLNLRSEGVEMHARSIFLQGLLVEPNVAKGRIGKKLKDVLSNWWVKNSNSKNLALKNCLKFAFNNQLIDKVIIGFKTNNELEETISILERMDKYPSDIETEDWDLDFKIIDPRRW